MDDTLWVCDITDSNGNWNLVHLRNLVLENIVTHIMAMLPPTIYTGSNRLAWQWMSKDSFSTAETFRHLYSIVETGISKV